jgi:hypothetical protein
VQIYFVGEQFWGELLGRASSITEIRALFLFLFVPKPETMTDQPGCSAQPCLAFI